ncbi:MAG: ABC transporter substrate-binding protein [Thermotaleaceae bacterium]
MKKLFNKNKFCIFTFLTIFTLTLLLGCAKPVSESSKPEQSDTERILVDHLNREVVLPEKPERILALTRAYMEELFELGVTPVGKVEEYTNRPEGVALPSVSNQATPDLEAIHGLNPDLILANTRQHGDLIEQLEETGASVFFVDPNRIDKDPLTDRILLFGEIMNEQEAAESYVEKLDTLSAELQKQVAEQGYQTGLLMQGGSETIQAAQPTGLYGALLSRLGIENIVPTGLPGSDKSTWVVFDIETILQKNPDVILVRAEGSKDKDPSNLLKTYQEDPQWQGLTAVQEGKLFILPAKVNPGSISNEEALKVTVKAICPQP